MTPERVYRDMPHEELVRRHVRLLQKVDDLTFSLEQLTEPPRGEEPPEAFCPRLEDIHLTLHERRFLGALYRRLGRTLTKENLVAAMNWDRPVDDWPMPKIVDVVACKVRKKVGALIDIETMWGVGYRAQAMVAKDAVPA